MTSDAAATGVRRGLPREPGGEPWPPASGAASGARSASDSGVRSGIGSEAPSRPDPVHASESAGASAVTAPAEPADGAIGATSVPVPPAEAPGALAHPAPRPPLTVARTVWPGAAARRSATRAVPGAKPRAAALGDYSPVQLLGSTAVLGVFALALVGIVVLLARFVLAIGPGREFLAAFPGEYHLPASAPVGLPAWLNWSHFLNSFFLLLIIRTGWQVRREKRPSAFWSPRNNKKRRISLALWFHQALDILWMANGVVFVVLLFVTGQWMRIVPTSWEVFPNALSAALQYASLDWPTENGWVNYNSLQQLSYFAITFVAAPLAIVSGVRLSGVWPKNAEKLNRLYPVEWARKVHFPTMLFFVAFIIVHVALVLATGALRNLNHMYAARGAVDPEAFVSDPTGLLIFAASLVVMAAAWVAARPAVLVPIARLFGEVKQR
ncbi:cytochrome b/b6 domain-containing protein [Microbacterium sp. SORGH_AS_0421]|uniref:cytochrome b/b6 domain-containing protein n=1 Tax=Microbacterium sp. SORGH_AS_0421 TaxID=3041768 RepID=UPI0027D864D5|nr:cytochrome b/b6 domain-containing protein [Microbacterium sp. SORGH_AS_0421]